MSEVVNRGLLVVAALLAVFVLSNLAAALYPADPAGRRGHPAFRDVRGLNACLAWENRSRGPNSWPCDVRAYLEADRLHNAYLRGFREDA